VPDPTSAEHQAWAKQNENRFNAFRAKWPDWAATALFYVAVHEVQALILDKTGERPDNHVDRNKIIKKHWRSSVWGPYEHLMQLSQEARYKCRFPTETQLNNAVLALAKLRLAVAAARASKP
jgi:hypothetical protein